MSEATEMGDATPAAETFHPSDPYIVRPSTFYGPPPPPVGTQSSFASSGYQAPLVPPPPPRTRIFLPGSKQGISRRKVLAGLATLSLVGGVAAWRINQNLHAATPTPGASTNIIFSKKPTLVPPTSAAANPAMTAPQQILYRGTDGAIDRIVWDGTAFHYDRWTDAAKAPVAVGTPTTMLTPNQQHLLYRGTDGAINYIVWDGSFHYERLTDVAKAPVASSTLAVVATASQQNIFYRGTNNALNHIMWDGTAFHYDRWTDAAKAPPVAGNPTTLGASS